MKPSADADDLEQIAAEFLARTMYNGLADVV